MRILVVSACLLLAIGAGPVDARKIYRITQPDGTIVFSDTPPAADSSAQTEEIRLRQIQTFTPPPVPQQPDPQKAASDAFPGYEEFKVSSPESGATLRDQGGNVSVSLSLKPSLQPGHKIELTMDGQPIGQGSSTSATLTNVDRGSHTIAATVMDADGKQLAKADPVTFTLHRTTRLLPAPRPQARRGG